MVIKKCPYGCERACDGARACGNVGVAVCWCVKVGNFFSKTKRKHFWTKMFSSFFFNFQFSVFSFQFLVQKKQKKKTPEVQGGFFSTVQKKNTHN